MIKNRVVTQFITFTSMEILRIIVSPIALLSILFLIAISGIPFLFPSSAGSHIFSFPIFAAQIPIGCIVIVPILGTNIWNYERHNNMYSMILSLPVHEAVVTISKFLSRFLVYLVFLVLTLPIAIISKTSFTMIINSYFALILFGLYAFSLMTFISTFIFSIPVALLISVVSLFFGMTIHFIPTYFILPYRISQLLLFLSLSTHIESFLRGILDSRDILFFILPSIVLLSASTKLMQHSRKKI